MSSFQRHGVVGSVVLISILLVVAACTGNTETASGSPATPGGPGGAGAQQQETDPVGGGSQTPTGCEELGPLTGSALEAFFESQGYQWLRLPLANRPVESRIGVFAVGAPSDLIGKTVALGVGANDNYEACTHCLAVALGCDGSCEGAAWFFPRSGSATFTALAANPGEPFEGKFTDVVLEYVTIDPNTQHSTPVPGGACLHIPELTFSANAGTSDPDAGGSTSSSTGGGGFDGGGGSSTSGGSSGGSSSGKTGPQTGKGSL